MRSGLMMKESTRQTGKIPADRRRWLRDSSITAKLATLVAINIAAILLLLVVVKVALDISGGVRAYVGGEGIWSKGQKDAVFYLSQYARTQEPGDYQAYLAAVSITLGDKKARLELSKPDYDYAVAEAGFVQGGNAAEDVPNLVMLFRRFGNFSYMADAIRIWTQADESIALLTALADKLHADIQAGSLTSDRQLELTSKLQEINAEVTLLEREFSDTLSEGARWIQAILMQVVLAASALLILIGTWLSFRIASELRMGILRLRQGAAHVAAGNLSHRIPSAGRDELGQLAEAFNEMAAHRQQAETDLNTSMQEARAVIETASDAFVSMDASGHIRDWNRQAENTFGWPQQSAIGKTLAELIFPPNHRKNHQKRLDHYLRTGDETRLTKRLEITALHRDGHEFPIELTIWPVQTGGSKRFNAFLHDISERQRMIRRLNAQKAAATAMVGSPTLEQAAPAVLDAICNALEWDVGALWLRDAKSNVLRCMYVQHRPGHKAPTFEKASRSMTFTRGAGLPGRVWDKASPAWITDVTQDKNFPRAPYAKQEGLHGAFAIPIFEGTEVSGIMEFFSGSIQQTDESLMRMMSTLGTLFGQFIARRKAEQELAIHTEELARSNAELERFAYVASHDLQEPLRTMTSYTQLLIRKFKQVEDEEARDFARFITEAAHRMRDLIDGLLAYSRVARNSEAAQSINLNVVLEQVIANLEVAIKAEKAKVTYDELPMVNANRTLIAHVLQNLIGNALKFRGPQPPRIHVSTTREDKAWRISVSDNGIGIDPKHAENIFILFQRLHTRERIPGNGLGLAICKKIIEQQGGHIWFEPANPGSIFHFTLPA